MQSPQANRPIGIAILGAAHMHANGVWSYAQQRPGMRLHWVFDDQPARALALARECEAQPTSDLDQVLADPRVEAAMVFAPTDGHDALVDAVVAAGKHLYVEKPLAISATRAWRLASRIARSPRLFSSGFVLRRRASHQFLKQQIQAGAFGRITRIRHINGHNGALRGLFDEPARQWFTQPSHSGGGGFLDEGTHSCDMVMWLLGQRPRRVTAALGNVIGRYPGCEEFGQGLMVFDQGAIGVISGSWVDAGKAVTLEVCGTEGWAAILSDRDLYVSTPHLPGADGRAPWQMLPPGGPHPLAAFLDALQGEPGGELVSVHDAAAAAAVMATMTQAAAAQAWIDVPGPTAGASPAGA
jgi:predicted dehydrogenase